MNMKKVIVSVLLAVFAAIPTAADSKTSAHALPFGAAANASRLDREAAAENLLSTTAACSGTIRTALIPTRRRRSSISFWHNKTGGKR